MSSGIIYIISYIIANEKGFFEYFNKKMKFFANNFKNTLSITVY